MLIINPLSQFPNRGIEVLNRQVAKFAYCFSAKVVFTTRDKRNPILEIGTGATDKHYPSEKEAVSALMDYLYTEETMIKIAQAYNKKFPRPNDEDEDDDE